MISDALAPDQFGYFGAAFALASIVAPIATVGQQSAIVKFWPRLHPSNPSEAVTVLLLSGSLVVVGCTVAVVLVLIGGSFLAHPWPSLILPASVLAVAMAASDFASGALRSHGSIWLALLPRDFVWRCLVILAVASTAGGTFNQTAESALVITAGGLILALLPQVFFIWRNMIGHARTPDASLLLAHLRSTLPFWGTNALLVLTPQATTVVVAFTLGPEPAALIFSAERTANLISIALNGVNQVIAPQLSRYYADGNLTALRSILSLTSAIGTGFAVLSIVVFSFFGTVFLSLFLPSSSHTIGYSVLMIISVGHLINAACGPCGWLLQLAGQERSFLSLLAVTSLLGVVSLVFASAYFGETGAAIAMSMTLVAWNVGAVGLARVRLGLDPSLLSFWQRSK